MRSHEAFMPPNVQFVAAAMVVECKLPTVLERETNIGLTLWHRPARIPRRRAAVSLTALDPFCITGSFDAKSNDRTIRDVIWRRYPGDDWAAFDQLPIAVRRRLTEHAYDAWSVNALVLWRHYRRLYPTAERAQRALLRYLDYCERLERRAFAEEYARRYHAPLPHEAAAVQVLRYGIRPEAAGAHP